MQSEQRFVPTVRVTRPKVLRWQHRLGTQLPEEEMKPVQGSEMPQQLPPLPVVKAALVGWEHQARDDGTLRRWWDGEQPQTV